MKNLLCHRCALVIVRLALLPLLSFLSGCHPASNSKCVDKGIVSYLVNSGIESSDSYLEHIWKDMNSDFGTQPMAWEAFYLIDDSVDAGPSLDFSRFCWFKCRESPLVFYMRHLSGDIRAFSMYERASLYDNTAYQEDGISDRDACAVLETIKSEIARYNQANGIQDDSAVNKMDEYIQYRHGIWR